MKSLSQHLADPLLREAHIEIEGGHECLDVQLARFRDAVEKRATAAEKKRLSAGIVASVDEALAALTSPDPAPKGSADYQRGWLEGTRSALEGFAAPFREVTK